MKNFIFISPNFPDNYWHFCAEPPRYLSAEISISQMQSRK